MRKNDEYTQIDVCRICSGSRLEEIIDLGLQALTGVFPTPTRQDVPYGPLVLVRCVECSLVQLLHSFNPSQMYGENYGYRSNLNPTMVNHLARKVSNLERDFTLSPGETVIDIGSNDGTLLHSYQTQSVIRFGFDPVAQKFLDSYEDDVEVVSDFFSAHEFLERSANKAKIITSIAMFYDLESPNDFVSDIAQSLAADGIWHFEQSYLPAMLTSHSYDTICHEHLEYYSFSVIKRLLEKHGLKVIDVQTNGINGGSLAVTASLDSSDHSPNKPVIEWLLSQEAKLGLDTAEPYENFRAQVKMQTEGLRDLIISLVDSGKTVAGYGASTKGNVLLQYCGLDASIISSIAEVNPSKWGCVTPGTRIPILPEDEVRSGSPDYMLVLPWHFRDFIVQKEQAFLDSKGKLIFPLPEIEIVS